MGKEELLIELFKNIKKCTKCEKFNSKIKEKDESNGLINIFRDAKIGLNIPSIWTDWLNRGDSQLMIVGQDWGPYVDMVKLHDKYCDLVAEGQDKRKAWSDIVNEPESMTKKMMKEFIIKSAKQTGIIVDEEILNSFYVTNAVLCARRGNNYRGNNNFKPKLCTENCTDNLKKEIEILKPLVIVTLGYWPFYSIAKSYNISIYKTLKENLERYSSDISNIINISNGKKPIYVVPVYHPTAQIKKLEQISYYCLIWKLLLKHYEKNELLKIMCSYNNYREKMQNE